MAVKVVMPRLTDTMLQGVISEWLKKEGDEVREGEPLYAVETDKASVEVTSSATGVLLKILVPQGDSVEVGGAVAIIGSRGEDFPPSWRPQRRRSRSGRRPPGRRQGLPEGSSPRPRPSGRPKNSTSTSARSAGPAREG